ncbi:hypothetical protein [Dehalobacterium formicoaceticum]|uniref:Uncharacterized protein n=1 Tax=Dehalobacterium formicoaceticum TaxID=51515 RepID=A0ABT1Y676_9FIRM|nr:hypothetical protein [Dehalobacterium formicoaceticum]MCR6546388.1 hypothetical protein [Dehalobacterium formicoaceticum]
MAGQEFGHLRSRAARKPWPECPEILIYRCNQCGKLYQGLGYDVPPQEPICCAASMEQLKPLHLKDVAPEIDVDYKIVGGFNQSAVQVFWETKQPGERPEWVLLKTFTGGYMKYVNSKKQPPLIFPLSDEDAYVYCDRIICQECVFRCKRGFIIYFYTKTRGLLEVPLEKIADFFKSTKEI